MRKLTIIFIFAIIYLLTLPGCKKNNSEINVDHEEVIMRKIGHEILLLSNDSTSLVLPIVYESGKYRIQFESNFSFLPDDLIKTIDTIIEKALPYNSYLVQVEACDTKKIVYSYEIDRLLPFSNDVVCKSREQPNACYEIVIQFIRQKEAKSYSLIFYTLLVIIFISIGTYFYKKNKRKITKGKIEIGAYLYDQKKMTLILSEKTIELTSKENELLSLLFEFVNETVTKETILNKVWGDEGDYVGRTLDVYASKLRKKLENDPSIQLKNIRGIGYQLIVED